MPAPDNVWLLAPDFTAPKFDEAVERAAGHLSLRESLVLRDSEEGQRMAILRLAPAAMQAAFTRFDLALDTLDPPYDEDYVLVFELQQADDEYAAPRFRLPFEAADNWAAAGLSGYLAATLAKTLGGVEITGDPPPWAAEELAASEEPVPRSLPALAIRSSALFPNHLSVLDVGREASVATIRGLVARGEVRAVFLLQRDPAAETPTTAAEFHPIGVAMRVLRIADRGESITVISKGIARVRIENLVARDDGQLHVEITPLDDVEVSVADEVLEPLRRFAERDPLIFGNAGASAKPRALQPGALCDFIAANASTPEAWPLVLGAVDVSKRLSLTLSIFGDLMAPRR